MEPISKHAKGNAEESNTSVSESHEDAKLARTPNSYPEGNGRTIRRFDLVAIFTLLLVVVTAGSTLYLSWKETKDRLLPILVLGPHDDPRDGATKLVIRNIGFGPALNSRTTDVTIPESGSRTRFEHRTAIGADQTESVRVYFPGKPEPFQKTDFLRNELLLLSPRKREICIAYENAHGDSYETRQALWVTSSNDLAIDFESNSRAWFSWFKKPCH